MEATRLTGLEIDHVEKECQLYGKDVSAMTNSRLFARFMSRFRFYNPLAEVENSYTKDGKPLPSLDTAWAHWEHITLPRYISDNGLKEHVKADVGEQERDTELYPVWKTSVRDLTAFGLSVRMYFSTLVAFSAFLFIAGTLNLPMVWYFWNYDADGQRDGIANVVKGSAVCDDTEWVACEDCNDAYAEKYPDYRLDGENVMINACNFEDWLVPGLFSYTASIVLLFVFGGFFSLQKRAEIVFDEEIQTASDYSIKVSNPPRDAMDPDEWRKFFKPFANQNATMVTIAIDNSRLISTLIKRRKALKKLRDRLPDDIDMSDKKAVGNAVMEEKSDSSFRLPFFGTLESLYDQVQAYEKTVRELVQRDYGAVAVFVTFETERAQRSCLHSLSTGKINVWRNTVDTSRFEGKELKVREAAHSSTLKAAHIADDLIHGEQMKEFSIQLAASEDDLDRLLAFRGEKVLAVKEAGEPNDVRWKDLQVSSKVRAYQLFQTNVLMFVFIAWSGVFISGLESNHPEYVPLYIAATNIAVPKICEFVNALESHSSEGNRNASLYVKVAIFRWFNSAVCLTIVLSFLDTISAENGKGTQKSLTHTVYSIIFAEMFTIPIIKLLDIMGNVRKHILAPRATDQEEMNSYFGGGKFELAERYSDATKVIFVSLFYSSILPESLYLGAIALLAHFWSGKFCLLRIWRPSPDIGPHLGRLSRNSFFPSALLAHVIMSAYFWSGYPYDNVCNVDGEYQYCNQDMFRSGIFPPLPRFQPQNAEWMSESQSILVSLYSYTAILMVLMALYFGISQLLIPAVESVFRSSYEPDGEDQGIDFSAVKTRTEVMGYIPQVKERGFSHPLLACDLTGIDEDLIGWKDHFHGFERHNLVNDVRDILEGQVPSQPIFSIVKHWDSDSRNQ